MNKLPLASLCWRSLTAISFFLRLPKGRSLISFNKNNKLWIIHGLTLVALPWHHADASKCSGRQRNISTRDASALAGDTMHKVPLREQKPCLKFAV